MIVFCPNCKEESFDINVTEGGSYRSENSMFPAHWFGGDGKCPECKYEGYYSDTSE